MKTVAVAGATRRIGSLASAALRAAGHPVVEIGRRDVIDLVSGDGLDDVLVGVDTVIDCTITRSRDAEDVVSFFTRTSANLLAAEERAGVGHHVALSIVGLTEPARNAYYAGTLAQEASVVTGTVPWTIVRATEFHDFAEMVVGWTELDGIATIAPVLIQPIAPADVAAVLRRSHPVPPAWAPRHRRPGDPGPRRHGAPRARRPRSSGPARPNVGRAVRRHHGWQGPATGA